MAPAAPIHRADGGTQALPQYPAPGVIFPKADTPALRARVQTS